MPRTRTPGVIVVHKTKEGAKHPPRTSVFGFMLDFSAGVGAFPAAHAAARHAAARARTHAPAVRVEEGRVGMAKGRVGAMAGAQAA